MTAFHCRRETPLWIGLLVVLAVTGCEEDVNDLQISDHPFTIYSIVNPKADTQFVRVFPVTETPSAFSSESPDAEVRFIDLETGDTFTAQHALTQFESGGFGHVYWAAFRPAFDRAYRVEARRDDALTAHATARTPPPSEVGMLEPYTRFDEAARDRVPIQPVIVRRSGGLLQRIEAVYYVEAQNIGRDYHAITYYQDVESVADGWRVDIDLVRDYARVYEEWQRRYRLYEDELSEQGVECCRVEFYGLEVRATVVDTAWSPPNGSFDPELLVEPGTFENVENGFGFVGAGYEENADIRVSRCFQFWAGYVFADDPCSSSDYCTFRGQRCGE